MQRSTAVLLVAGGTALFVTLGVLVRAVHSESSASDASTSSHPSAPIASRTDPSAEPSRSTTPPWRGSVVRHIHRDEADDSSSASAAPSLDEHAPPATRANTKNLEFGGKQLRAQTAAVEPLVVKCIADAVAAGQSPTGKATLTYIVTQRGDKVFVEDTGVDEDKTTLPSGELLDCLRETSRSMKFEGLPREADGIVVTRAVTVDHGKLVGNKHVTFSYLR
jgi:hypothetical protein